MCVQEGGEGGGCFNIRPYIHTYIHSEVAKGVEGWT